MTGEHHRLPHRPSHTRPVQRSGTGPVADDRRGDAERLERLQRAASGHSGGPAMAALQRALASSGASGGVIQRKSLDDLVEALRIHFPGTDRLEKATLTGGLQSFPAEDRTDPNFARAMVEFVKERNGSEFEITDLEEAPNPGFGRKHLGKSWTFRHYTNEKFDSLQSLADLEAQGIDASKNTNDRDWEELGNQGYVFGLLAVDGRVPGRTWLSTMKYYAEYDLNTLPSIWVSADMLTEEGRTKNSFQGSGDVIIAQLSKMLGFIGQDEANALDAKFAGALEAKVPPAHLGEPDWQDNG